MAIVAVGIDLAKNAFAVYGVGESGKLGGLIQAPRTMRAVACVPGLAHADPAFPEFAVARAAPLFPCRTS